MTRYRHRFTFYDREADIELSDVIEIHTLELLKLPPTADGTELYDWAKSTKIFTLLRKLCDVKVFLIYSTEVFIPANCKRLKTAQN